jgi:hypothetical protein
MATAQQVFEERVRTVEQIKRLYAVAMGFAATTCLTNIYGCARAVGFADTYSLSILAAQGIAFVSLITLFYLGNERLFEIRYLRPDSPVPTRLGLLIDLAACGVTASYFIVLSNTFPDPAGAARSASFGGEIAAYLHTFARNLLILYAIDLAFLLIQLVRIARKRPDNWREASYAHVVWIVLNAVSFGLLLWVFPDWEADALALGGLVLSAGALFVGLLHAVRFLADFLYTFEFYYPMEDIRPHHTPTAA